MPLKLVAVVTTVLCQKFGKPIKFYRLVCSRIPKKNFKNITSHFCNVTICSLAAPWFKIPPSTWITIARSKWTTDSFFPFRVMGRASPGRPNVTSGAWLGCMKRLKISSSSWSPPRSSRRCAMMSSDESETSSKTFGHRISEFFLCNFYTFFELF